MEKNSASKSFYQVIGWIFLALAFLLFVLLLSLPSILSTTRGQKFLITQVNHRIPGKISAKKIQLSWFGQQQLQGAVLKDPEGRVVLSLDSLSADTPLYTLLWNGMGQINSQLSGLNAHIVQEANHPSNLQRALGIQTSEKKGFSPLPYSISLKDMNAQFQATKRNEPIKIHFAGKTEQQGQVGSFEVDALIFGFEPDQIQQVKAKINQLPIELLEQFVALQNPKYSGLLRAALGHTLDATLEQNQSDRGAALQLSLTSPQLQATLEGHLTADDFKLTRPGNLTFNLTPEIVQQIAGESKTRLTQSTTIRFTLEQLTLPLTDRPVQHSDLIYSGLLTLDPLHLEGLPNIGEVVIQGAKVEYSHQQLMLTADVIPPQNHPWLKHTPIQLWLDNAKGFSLPLSGMLVVDTCKAKFNLKPGGLLDLDVKGDDLVGQASLTLGDFITLNHEATVDLVMSPKRFSELRKMLRPNSKDKFVLQDTARAGIKVISLKLPWGGLGKWSEGSLVAEVALDKFHVTDQRTNQYMGFENIRSRIKSEGLGQAIDFDLNGEQHDRSNPVSHLFVKGNVQNLLSPSGRWNTNDMSLGVQAKFQRLPAGLLCEVACLEKLTRAKLEALFGPQVDLDLDISLTQMNGPLHLYIEGPLGKVSLDGQLRRSILTLSKPFEAELTVTPELSESVIADVLPILRGMVKADERLRFSIDPRTFSLPVAQADLVNIQIGQMTVDLGRVWFNNEGHVAKILHILKAKNREFISVWFTPIYLSLDAGVVRVKRFDMLAVDSYPLATWGQIDIPGDDVDMKIGLSGKSLRNAIGIPIPGKSYMMTFPLRGTLDNASIDKTKLTARIASLTAQLAGGPQGLLIGTVLGIATGAYTEDAVPPATTNPLPWDTAGDDEEQAEAEAEGESKKNPLKSVERGVNSLLKSILK